MHSEPLKLAFIHIPRTAGESLAAALRPFGLQGVKHQSYRDFCLRNGRASAARFTFATIVRNPWDQVLSFYSHLRKPMYMSREQISPYAGYFADGFHLSPLEPSRSACQLDFQDWVQRWYGDPPVPDRAGAAEKLAGRWPRLARAHLTKITAHAPYRKQALDPKVPYLMPYLEWLRDAEGRVCVDFVGRFETLAADFRKLMDRLGVHAELSHLNRSTHGEYRDCYDARTRETVARYYAEEIKTFEYRY